MEKKRNISVINPVLKWVKLYPFHVILLPLFYILHNFLHLRGVLTVNDFIIGLCKLILCQLIFYILFYISIRNHPKTALIITTGSIIFLFFGQIKDTLFQVPIITVISSYKILLPLLCILFIFFLRKVSKKGSVKTATLFLNLLFSTYLIIEFINLESSERNISLAYKIELANASDSIKQTYKPDIYYLVFDGYPSSSFQKEKLQIDFNFLDTNLISRNFYVAKEPVSLYNYTAFSIASTFNMNYLTWLDGIKRPKPEHFSKAVMQIKKSSFTSFLEKGGYEIKNYSFFSLNDKPSLTSKKLFYEVSPKIIFGNSLWNRVKWQLVPNIFPSYIYTLYAEQNKRSAGGYK